MLILIWDGKYPFYRKRGAFEKDEEVDEEKIINDFIEKLHSYQLFILQSRIYNKLLIIAYSINTNGRVPVELRSQYDLASPEKDFFKSNRANPRSILSQKRNNFGQENNS